MAAADGLERTTAHHHLRGFWPKPVLLVLLILTQQQPFVRAQTCPRTVPRHGTVGSWRDSRMAASFMTANQARAASEIVKELKTNGFPDTAPTAMPRVLASDSAAKIELRVAGVATAYMDDGKSPLTDRTGRPIKFATVAISTSPGSGGNGGSGSSGARATLALVQVPVGYSVDAQAIQEALATSLVTGRGQTFLPPPGIPLGKLPKDYATQGASATGKTPATAGQAGASQQQEGQGQRWSVWEGALGSPGGDARSPGEILFDEAGQAFSTRPWSVVTSASSREAVTQAGFPDVGASNTDANGNRRECRRRVVNGKLRYYCRKNSE